MTDIERRKTARIYKKLKIEVGKREKLQNLGSIDLTPMGVRFRTNKKVPLFKQLDFKIDLSLDGKNKEELICQATVIRCEKSQKAKGYHVTLFFHDLKKKDVKRLEDYIIKLRG
ncbi:MAG: PilZ domain-containing protein [Candidatus Aureabacteria bacterium]|nr:PilZ domain-containing protein [Candidatus Auribacterota bacterium]